MHPLHFPLSIWLLLFATSDISTFSCLHFYIAFLGSISALKPSIVPPYRSTASMLCLPSHFSHVWLCVTPMDCSPLDSSVHDILQEIILEWVAMPSRGSSWPRDRTHISYVSCIRQVGSLPLAPPGKPLLCLSWEYWIPQRWGKPTKCAGLHLGWLLMPMEVQQFF